MKQHIIHDYNLNNINNMNTIQSATPTRIFSNPDNSSNPDNIVNIGCMSNIIEIIYQKIESLCNYTTSMCP